MSLSIHPARRSALGVTWCEDFSRGRLGVRKNGGIVTGAPVLSGEWMSLDGAADYITYPRARMGCDSLTVSISIRNCTTAGWGWIITQYGGVGARDFGMQIRGTDGAIYIYMFISGTARNAHTTLATLLTGTHDLVATWATGDRIRLYDNGVQIAQSGAAYAGTIDDVAPDLVLGAASGGAVMSAVELAEPIIDRRQWSAAEVLAHYNRSLFH